MQKFQANLFESMQKKNKNTTYVELGDNGDDSDSSDAIMQDNIKIAIENSLKTINQPPPSHQPSTELPPSISQSPASAPPITQPPPPPPPPKPSHNESMI